MRTIRQRLSLERGRVSMISTTSPTCDELASSCAWQTVRLLSILPYLGWGRSRSTKIRRVLLILSDVTIPTSVLRRLRVGGVFLLAGIAWLIENFSCDSIS